VDAGHIAEHDGVRVLSQDNASGIVMPIEFHRDGPWELPEGWVWARAADFAGVIGGGTPKNASDETNFDPNGTPWITPADLSGYSASHIDRGARSLSVKGLANCSARRLPQGSLLISSRAPVGYCVVASNEVATNQGFKSLAFKIPACPEFFRYYVVYNRRYFVENASGTTFKELSGEAMSGLLFPIAPLEEQRRIVARVDELFTDIADGETALARARDDLDTWRRALLKAAVTGELTREWRQIYEPTETGEELLKRIRIHREKLVGAKRRSTRRASRQMEDAEQSRFEIPDTWCWTTWSDIGVSQNGRPFPSRDYARDGIKLLRPGNLYANGRVRWTNDNTRFLPTRYLDENPDLLVAGREIIINLTAQSLKDEFLGRTCMTDSDEQCLLNQRLARLTPIDALPEFMLIVFKSPLFRSFVRHLNSGSLIQHMFTSQIDSFEFPLPPIAEQEAIIDQVRSAIDEVDELAEPGFVDAVSASGFRQSILKAAFEGRLVAQDPHDEPAERLLARLGEPGEEPTRPRRARKARRVVAPAE
jgi:type I restriction enzyme, S subunit